MAALKFISALSKLWYQARLYNISNFLQTCPVKGFKLPVLSHHSVTTLWGEPRIAGRSFEVQFPKSNSAFAKEKRVACAGSALAGALCAAEEEPQETTGSVPSAGGD